MPIKLGLGYDTTCTGMTVGLRGEICFVSCPQEFGHERSHGTAEVTL